MLERDPAKSQLAAAGLLSGHRDPLGHWQIERRGVEALRKARCLRCSTREQRPGSAGARPELADAAALQGSPARRRKRRRWRRCSPTNPRPTTRKLAQSFPRTGWKVGVPNTGRGALHLGAGSDPTACGPWRAHTLRTNQAVSVRSRGPGPGASAGCIRDIPAGH